MANLLLSMRNLSRNISKLWSFSKLCKTVKNVSEFLINKHMWLGITRKVIVDQPSIRI